MNILSSEDDTQNLYLVRVLPEAGGGHEGIAVTAAAATAGRRPRKEVS